jgi:hypothetical protein
MTSAPSKKQAPSSDLEAQKLEFEKEKQSLEEQWRKRTFIWSISSTLLGAVVAIAVPLVSSGGKDAKPHVSLDAVVACRTSLQRLPTLANSQGQTVDNLKTVIAKHDVDCDQVLVDMIAYLGKSGS